MREDLLHFIWKYKKFTTRDLKTSEGHSVEILDLGYHNKHSGPDFMNASIYIDKQLWAGNVEIHIRASDWYMHGHQADEAYKNVILHVVWEEDRSLIRQSGELIPALVLSKYVDKQLLARYNELLRTKKNQFIPCIDQFSWSSVGPQPGWMQQLYRERLEDKTQQLLIMLKSYKMDWEKLLFASLLKNFGQHVNARSFLSLANALDFKIVRKLGRDTFRLECILLGLCGILKRYHCDDPYGSNMFKEYLFLKRKYNFIEERIEKPEFMRVRPSNFPTIRLSQFAVLYSRQHGLFSKLMAMEAKEEYYEFFNVEATEYWNRHYVFGKPSVKKTKRLSKTFINSILINTVLPVKNIYNREHGRDVFPKLRNLLHSISREKNVMINKYRDLGIPVRHAMDSQALLQLYDQYCTKKRCLECAIGNQILN